MRPTTQDTPAQRISPSQFDTVLPEDARSELVRPRRARILTRPPSPPQKRSIADSVRSRWHPALGWLLALAGVVAVCAIIGLSQPSQEKRERALQESANRSYETEAKARKALDALRTSKSTPAIAVVQPAPAVQPTPASTPAGVVPIPVLRASLMLYKRWAGNGVWELTDSSGRVVKILIDPAPRAQLANPPAPKAELVKADTPQIGQAYSFTMPYDGSFEVQGTLRGYLDDVRQLPRNGNAIGDTWLVDEHTPWVWVTVPGTLQPTWVDP